MSTIDKLVKYLQSSNICEFIDLETQEMLADKVITGYKIDDDSRQNWLEVNLESIKLIETTKDGIMDEKDREFPFHKSSKVVHPLLSSAAIQLSARLTQQLVRNNKVIDCATLGQDHIDPQTHLGIKESKASRVSEYLSWEVLIDSDNWLPDSHKWIMIACLWGVAYKEVYRDEIEKKTVSEIVDPQDIIINKNTVSLDKAIRITKRLYLTKNDIISQIRAGKFNEVDFDKLKSTTFDNENKENDSREINPVYEVLKQFCYYDLDNDEYEEPYCVYVMNQSKQMLGIYPAFELDDLNINQKGEIISIKMRHNLVDLHLLDAPDGSYYSLGLNHLLLHLNRAINSVERQLLDAGTLANTASSSGFVTKILKTKERNMRVKLGEFTVVDLPMNARLGDQFYNLPFKEPSQVLLGLLELLINTAKETGFMTDVLTGDAQMQNVPATTMLAQVEQGTRAFKPVVQKLHNSLKKEFKIRFHLAAKYLDKMKYIQVQGIPIQITKDDFDESNMDIMPVADPTMCSEAHKYARLQFLFQLFQTPVAQAMNVQQSLLTCFSDLQFPDPESLIAPPQPPQPDPKMMQMQINAQLKQKDQELMQLKEMLNHQHQQVQEANKQTDLLRKAQLDHIKTAKMVSDAHKDAAMVSIENRRTNIDQYKAETERERIKAMDKPSDNSTTS